MKLKISAKNIDLTDKLKTMVEEKLSKLDHFFSEDTQVNVMLSAEKDRQKIEVTIPMKGQIIRSEQSSQDMYASIDMVEDVIERQLRRHHRKLIEKHRNPKADFTDSFINESDEEEGTIDIIRTKRFGIKPMYPEDACVQMELLGHDFFVFFNAQTEEVNVVYKRKDGAFGLIEPEF